MTTTTDRDRIANGSDLCPACRGIGAHLDGCGRRTDRDLTPTEVAKLDKLRVLFSGQPDADEVIAETRRDMLALPVPTSPCPSWCDYAEGHVFDPTDGVDPSQRTVATRWHEQGIGDYVTVCQQETVTLSDGAVSLGTPYLTINTDEREFTSTDADRLASCLTQASALLREIAGSR